MTYVKIPDTILLIADFVKTQIIIEIAVIIICSPTHLSDKTKVSQVFVSTSHLFILAISVIITRVYIFNSATRSTLKMGVIYM